jgi:segregation and condensation protein B
MPFNLKQVLQALLFSSNQPLSIAEIQDTFTRFHEQAAGGGGLPASQTPPENSSEPPIVPLEAAPAAAAAGRFDGILSEAPEAGELYQDVPSLVPAAQIRETLEQLALELRADDGVFLLVETAQGYRLVTQPRFARWVRALRNEPPPIKLSQSAMETLAVIAYRQPVTRAEIEHIRGVSAEAGLNRLLERDLVYIVGRADLPGRPIQYGTTEAFLEFIGVKSLDELPASDVLSRRQIDGWLQNAMDGVHPSDHEMGLSEEGEEQLSLDDAARATAAREFVALPADAPGPVRESATSSGGVPEASTTAASQSGPA